MQSIQFSTSCEAGCDCFVDIATVAIPDGAGVGLKGGRIAAKAAEEAARAAAASAANGARLSAQLAGEEIAAGHAFQKHVIDLGEFPGITTPQQFASHIEDVVINGEMRTLTNGRTAYWQDGTVVIRNPNAVDGGTAFRPQDGYTYFTEDLH